MYIRIAKAVLWTMLGLAVPACAAVIIKSAPPPPVSTAVLGLPPSPKYVWIPGYYKGVNGRYIWMPGRWAMPPHPGAVWVPPHWTHRKYGYAFAAGYWR